MKWHLTTKCPEKTGNYLVITRYGIKGLYREYSEPYTLEYSKEHDGWNCRDGYGGAKSRMEDLRDVLEGRTRESSLHCVYAWCKVPTPSPEKLDALEVAE